MLWFAEGASTTPLAAPPVRPWYSHKHDKTFADILRAARRALRAVDVLDPACYFGNLANLKAVQQPPRDLAADMAA